MKKIVLTFAALAAVSSVALADNAFDKQLKRNMIENPDRYSHALPLGFGGVTSSDALAIDGDYGVNAFGNKRFVGPGEDGRQAR
jgi:hypothetical protein